MIIYITVMYNMLKMKKMNGLKIFALVLLSLSKFETMFGMEENEIEDNINDKYVNKNYYLIDNLGNKITLDSGEDIKFKIYSEEKIKGLKCYIYKDILKIHEKEKEKTLVTTINDDNNEEITYLAPILYKNREVILKKEKKTGSLYPMCFDLAKENREKYKENTIQCIVIKKIGDDSINHNYILVDAEKKKIEKIKGKNIVFKLLTRKKYLELKEKLDNPENFLKNDKKKYILDYDQNPLFFEEENNVLILYVRLLKDDLCLARLLSHVTTINFDKDNSIAVRMSKKEEIDKVAEKKVEIDKIDKEEGEKFKKEVILEDDDSSKCCCGIC